VKETVLLPLFVRGGQRKYLLPAPSGAEGQGLGAMGTIWLVAARDGREGQERQTTSDASTMRTAAITHSPPAAVTVSVCLVG